MNKSYVIGAVAVLAVALLAWAGISGRGSNPNTSDTASTSLRDLLVSGEPVRCTFSTQTEGQVSAGEVFVASAEKVRADFTTQINNTEQTGHMVMKDKKIFVWLDGQAQGMTMAVPENGPGAENNQTPLNFDDKNVSYDCDDWRVDEAKFIEPSDIKFSDLSAMMGASTSVGATANPPQCAACDQLAGAQKAQCRTALKCQ